MALPLSDSISLSSTAALNDSLATIAQQYGVLGMNVLVVTPDSIRYSYNYGISNTEKSTPVTDTTFFRIASISKSFVASGIMLLLQKGLLDLDQDINLYLGYSLRNPSFPETPLTIRQLLTHTSSLSDGPNYEKFLMLSYSDSIYPITSYILPDGSYYNDGDCWQEAEPGTTFEYCNLAFGILGTIIEKVSHQRFDQYMVNQILKPLGMQASFNIQDIADLNHLATIYRYIDGQWVPQKDDYNGNEPQLADLSHYELGTNGLIFSPQGGLRCHILDMARFLQLFLDTDHVESFSPFKTETISQMMAKNWSGESHEGLYKAKALGLHITEDLIPGVPLIGHSGSAYGLHSDMYADLDNHRFGIIFMTNGLQRDLKGERVFNAIEEDVFRAVYQILINAKGNF